MNLPIDMRNAPFKPKYVEDETPMLARWMVFGTYDDGTVGISDGQEDIFVGVPPAAAESIVQARDVFVDAMMQHLSDFGETHQPWLRRRKTGA